MNAYAASFFARPIISARKGRIKELEEAKAKDQTGSTPMSLLSKSFQGNASPVNAPKTTSDAEFGHNTGFGAKGLRGGETGKGDQDFLTNNDAAINHRAAVTPVGSAVEKCGNHVKRSSCTAKNVSPSSSVGMELKQNTVDFESKKGPNDRNNCKDESFTVSTEERYPLLSIEDGSKRNPSQSMEETYKRKVLFENRSDDADERSDYRSLNKSDAETDGSSCQERTRSKSSEDIQDRDKQDWLLSNPEGAAIFGADDLRDFLHEHDVEIDWSAALWEDPKNHDTSGIQVDMSMGADEDNRVEFCDVRDVPKNDCLARNTVQVRGTGRPDLDDAEYYFGTVEEGSDAQSATTTFLDGFGVCEQGRPDLKEDEKSIDYRVIQDNDLEGTCGVGSGTRVLSPREYKNDAVELHKQDDLRSVFNERLSRYVDSKVTPEIDIQQDGISDPKSKFLHCTPSTRIRFVQPPEMLETERTLQASDGSKDTDVHVVNVQNLIPEKNLEGCVNIVQHILSHDVPEEDSDQEETLSEIARDSSRKTGRVVRLGSKEAVELPQMDVAKLGKAVYAGLEPSSNGSPVPIYKRASVDWAGKDLGPDELSRYVEALEVKETYIDTVLDMEDILFDAEEGAGARILQGGNAVSQAGDRPARDGTVSASTSSEPASISRQIGRSLSNLNEVDWVEVVGALQRRGGASFGDRVVGVKEHTIYRIKVYWGGYDWEIHRRYREFVALHNQLRQLFTHNGAIPLPMPWGKVNAESRKFFGNTSPGVVEVRSALIQVCLQSLLQAGPPLSTATPLLRFLFPDREVSHSIETSQQVSGTSKSDGPLGLQGPVDDFAASKHGAPLSYRLASKDCGHSSYGGGHTSVFGKTIRLMVQIQQKKSLKQQLQAQHFTCAGCYKHLELALGLLPELVQNWGWTGPRFCEYSGQIFCSTCHLNEAAVIPAWVLQRWDFTPRHVSQLAKAYLDSIYDKPMLCVSAVNPYLYARVPVLALLTDIRRNLSKMLVGIRCPARARIHAMMGSRRYLLESNDFFALRDLADLSKGAFAVLPGYMQALLLKLSVHISKECSACGELGEACGAGELCCYPCDVIFPYQEKGITRCQSCHAPYHKGCRLNGNNCCPWRKGQSDQILNEQSYISDVYTDNAESHSRISLSSSIALGKEDASVTSGKKPLEAKSRLLTNLLRSEEL